MKPWTLLIPALALAPPAAAQDKPPELLADSLYRSAGGSVTLRLPQLKKPWIRDYRRSARATSVIFKKGTLKRFTAFAEATCFARGSFGQDALRDGALAKELLALLEKRLTATEPRAKPAQEARPFRSPGGHGWGRPYVLPGPQVQPILLAAIADGDCGVTLFFRAVKSEWPGLQAGLMKSLFEGVRVGSKVARLPRHDPKVRLEGVYEGRNYDERTQTTSWITFDPRGYCVEMSPGSEYAVDVLAVYQGAPQRVRRYTVADGKLTLEPVVAGSVKTRSRTFQRAGAVLTIDGEGFDRADILPDDCKLDGHYKFRFVSTPSSGADSFTFSGSSSFYFKPDGRFSTDSKTFMAATTNATGPVPPGGFRSWTSLSDKAPSKAGRYRVLGNRLLLEYANGRKVKRTILCQWLQDGAYLRLMIGGTSYRKQ